MWKLPKGSKVAALDGEISTPDCDPVFISIDAKYFSSQSRPGISGAIENQVSFEVSNDRMYVATYKRSQETITVHRIGTHARSSIEFEYFDFSIQLPVPMSFPYHCFYSVSSRGHYVAVSWLQARPESSWSPEISHCCIYKDSFSPNDQSQDGRSITQPYHKIHFQGSCRFLPNNKLVLTDIHHLRIYSDTFDFLYLIDLFQISQMTHQPIARSWNHRLMWFLSPSKADTSDDMNRSLGSSTFTSADPRINLDAMAKDLHFMTKCIYQGVLLDYSSEDNLVRIWSVQDGHLIISLKTSCDSNTVFSVSNGGGLVAKFSSSIDDTVIKLFDIESGLLVNSLKIRDTHISGTPVSIEFIENDRYLACVSHVKPLNGPRIRQSLGPNDAVYGLEIWDIVTGTSVVYQETASRISRAGSVVVMGHPSYRASTLIVESAGLGSLYGHKLRSFPVSKKQSKYIIPEEVDELPWDQLSPIIPALDPQSKEDIFFWSEFHDKHALSPGIASYFLDTSKTLVLRIGRYSVQVWRTKRLDKHGRHPQNEDTREVDPATLGLHKLVYMYCIPLEYTGSSYNIHALTKEIPENQKPSIRADRIRWYTECNRRSGSEFFSEDLFQSAIPDVDFSQGNYRLRITYESLQDGLYDTNGPSNQDEIYIPFKIQAAPFIGLKYIFNSLPSVLQLKQYFDEKDWKTHHFDSIAKQMQSIVKYTVNCRSPFFGTIAGNQALSSLLCSPGDDDLLCTILDGTIDIKTCFHDISRKQSPLTVAIQNGSPQRVKMLVEYIITASRTLGPGYLAIFVRVLPELCKHFPDLVPDWIRSLSYVPAISAYPLVSQDSPMLPGRNLLTHKQELWGFSALEQLPVYRGLYNKAVYTLKTQLDVFKFGQHKKGRNFQEIKRRQDLKEKEKRIPLSHDRKPHLATLCVVPLPSYTAYTENFRTILTRLLGEPPGLASAYSRHSLFTVQASTGSSEVFRNGEPVMEALLIYKWRMFARNRFFLIYLVYIAYYTLYSIGVAFSKEVFNYDAQTRVISPAHRSCLILMMAISFLFITQETRQIMVSRTGYFRLFYNYISLVAVCLPLIATIVILSGHAYPVEASAISVLILWLHAIVRLRVLKEFGIMVEIVVQISKRVLPMFALLIFIVFAFAHTFIVLLRNEKNGEFAQSFDGIIGGTQSFYITSRDPGSENKFRSAGTALKAVWLFVNGDWEAISDKPVEDQALVTVLGIILSFSTTLILLNILIALMTDVVEEVKRKGKRVWISYLAESLAEIELYWCFPWERRNRKYHPDYIYYVAYVRTIEDYKKSESEED
ncbi:hypothetical protein CLU79DRAFT_759081 [Phycomyces nitens]|nr:hypothetical protein CLU79DRAFT_759081 [Phycomyces nitens]